jgi:hypothetical protein
MLLRATWGSEAPTSETAPFTKYRQSRAGSSVPSRLLQWNANSHANRRGYDCPSAPAMQHPGGADLTAPPLATNSRVASTRAAASPTPPGLLHQA